MPADVSVRVLTWTCSGAAAFLCGCVRALIIALGRCVDVDVRGSIVLWQRVWAVLHYGGVDDRWVHRWVYRWADRVCRKGVGVSAALWLARA